MYIGIHISDSYISAGIMGPDGEVKLVNDQGITGEKKFLTPLAIYIENHYTFLGNQVDYLVANNPNLVYGRYFMDNLECLEHVAYTDESDQGWNTAALLSLFLKKLQADIQIYDDRPIKGAVMTVTKNTTPTMSEVLKLTFEMADIPLCGVLEMGKAALLGYGISADTTRSKRILLYDLNPLALTVGFLELDVENYSKTRFLESNKTLGEWRLYQYFAKFLTKRYQNITGKRSTADEKNNLRSLPLAKEVLTKYLSGSEPYINVIYHLEEPIIELTVTRAQIEALLSKYMQEVIGFLQENLKTTGIGAKDIDEVMLTGTSKMFPIVQHHLQSLFRGHQTKLHNFSPEEVLTKGATLYANNPVEREISSSLLAETSKLNTAGEQPITTHDKNTPDLTELNSLINKMHINIVCDF